MTIHRHAGSFVSAVVLLMVFCGVSAAGGELCDFLFRNALEEEIIDIRLGFPMPYGPTKFSRTRVGMSPDGEHRIGVFATTLPEAIRIDLAMARYVFKDLSGLNPEGVMRLEVVQKDGKPWIRRLDAQGEAEGVERRYLTPSNLPDAIDKDALAACSDVMDVVELLDRRVGDGRNRHEANNVAEAADGDTLVFVENDGWGQNAALSRPLAAPAWNRVYSGRGRPYRRRHGASSP